MATVAQDTIPCDAPESGEHAVAQIEVRIDEGPPAPRYVESVIAELRGILGGVRCVDHGAVPAVTVAFGEEDDATVAVVSHNCCPLLDDLLADALKGSPIFRLTSAHRHRSTPSSS